MPTRYNPLRLVRGAAALDNSDRDDRAEAVVGAIRILEALGSCGESLTMGDGDRSVYVFIRCLRPDCPVCQHLDDFDVEGMAAAPAYGGPTKWGADAGAAGDLAAMRQELSIRDDEE